MILPTRASVVVGVLEVGLGVLQQAFTLARSTSPPPPPLPFRLRKAGVTTVLNAAPARQDVPQVGGGHSGPMCHRTILQFIFADILDSS